MVAITNTTSLTFLKDAIDTTLAEAEAGVEAFSEDQSQVSVVERCAESFHQLRGICQMLEFSAAALLSEEMELACQELKRRGERPLIQALSNAIVLLGRYFEYVQLKDHTLPEMLIGGINELRRAGGKAMIQESHFFSVDLSRPRTPPVAPGDHRALTAQGRRLRHMYQVGLLGLLRGQHRDAHLKLMARALARVDALCGECANSRFWWVARAATESLALDALVITPARKALLSQYDRQLKKLVYDGDHAMREEAPLLLIKESLYLASLGSGRGPAAAEVRAAYGRLGQGISDEALQHELALMTGSRGSVIRSVADALKEEINQIKDILDLAAQGVTDTDYATVAAGLRRVASTLEMIGKEHEATLLRERANEVAGWPVDAGVESTRFHALVDDLLAAENTVASLERSLAPADDVRREATNERISLYQLDEARMTVVAECRAGLALAKRSLAAFMENQWDSMHLTNLPGTFATVSGGLMFLELDRACQVVKACRRHIEEKLIGGEPPGQPVMETLADALTGIDYYLESMEEHKPIGEGVLDVAERAMAELGYAVEGTAMEYVVESKRG